MTPEAEALVAELRARGVKLRAVGDKLRYRPADAVSAEDVEALRAHKGAVMALLRAAERPAVASYAHPWPDDLDRLGPRRLGPFASCEGACGRSSWVRYGVVVLCLPCAFAWLAPPEAGQ